MSTRKELHRPLQGNPRRSKQAIKERLRRVDAEQGIVEEPERGRQQAQQQIKREGGPIRQHGHKLQGQGHRQDHLHLETSLKSLLAKDQLLDPRQEVGRLFHQVRSGVLAIRRVHRGLLQRLHQDHRGQDRRVRYLFYWFSKFQYI